MGAEGTAGSQEWHYSLMTCVILLDLISFFVCAGLSCRLIGLNAEAKNRLFVQQLRSLLLVGACMHLGLVPDIIMDFGCVNYDFASYGGCTFALVAYMPFFFTSLLQELHIAISFVVQSFPFYFRYPLANRWLSRSIPLVWCCGLALGALYAFLNEATPLENNNCDIISPCVVSDSATNFVGHFLAATVGIGLLSYVTATVRAWRAAPGSVSRRNFQRAAIYPLSFVLSHGLVIYVYAYGLLHNAMWLASARALQSTSGLLNAVAYITQSRKAQQLLLVNDSTDVAARNAGLYCGSQRRTTDFTVSLGGVDILDIAPVRLRGGRERLATGWVCREEEESENPSSTPATEFQMTESALGG